MNELAFTVSEFVAILNQTLEYAYPNVTITGELANFRVAKGRWVYFDLKDESATVRFFGTVQHLPGPLQDGMMLAVQGSPRLHAQYGFSVNILRMQPVGEGSIKKAAALLEAKLAAEGLFDPARKRALPYPPQRIGLVTSAESAAYRDFIKVVDARWGGLEIMLADVQVQGQASPAQLVAAIEQLNGLAEPPDVLVMTRGGGSAEDLQAFSTEQVARAVAASRIPTLVAIGHEIDLCLSELAADQRASTPSNAAELLVPDRKAVRSQLKNYRERLGQNAWHRLEASRADLAYGARMLHEATARTVAHSRQRLQQQRQLLTAFDPQAALQRGYAIVRSGQAPVRSGTSLHAGQEVAIQLCDAQVAATVTNIIMNQGGH